MVSIVMPAFNSEKHIAESIESVMAQTYKDWELLIVDDCSTDNTCEVIKRYLHTDDRVIYTKLNENSGPAAARNKGIEIARGDYIAFLDSDDLWLPEKLEKQIRFMKDNRYLFTCTAYEKIDEDGRSLNCTVWPYQKADYNKVLLTANPVGNSTAVFDAEALGRFKVPNIAKRNDFALWLQILKKSGFVYGMPETLMKYRVRKHSVSSDKLELAKYHWQLYRDIEQLSVVKAAFYMFTCLVIKILKPTRKSMIILQTAELNMKK